MVSILLFCESRYPINRAAIKKTVEKVLGEKQISGNVEVGVSVIGDRKMAILNKKYRGKEGTTNVLSFSQTEGKEEWVAPPDGKMRLGDIVVSYPQARKGAGEKEILVDEEINMLVRHSLLHLLGIHHE